MKIIATLSHKGGVGKSATTHAIAEAMAEMGHKVLCIDNDAQASLTNAFGIQNAEGTSMAEVYGSMAPGSKTLKQIIQGKSDGEPHIAPADLEMAINEMALFMRPNREYILKSELKTVAPFYDYCIIDCSPSAGLFTYNALAASDYVVIPSIPEIGPVRGIRLALRTISNIKQHYNDQISVIGILPTMYNERTTHHQLGFEALKQSGLDLFPVAITRTVKVSEAMAVGQSIVTYEPKHKVADQCRRAATYIIQKAV